MQVYAKELSDTDSIYCAKPTNSHQSSVFIGPTDGPVPCGLFGSNYVSDMDVVIELSRDNLLLNVLFHYLGGVKYKKRGTLENWDFNKDWLSEKQLALYKAFGGPTARFHVSINKETTRTYLKGIAGARLEGGAAKLDVRNYLFSGDTLRMGRKDDGTVVIVVADRGGENRLFDSVKKEQKMAKAGTEVQKEGRLLIALKMFQRNRAGVEGGSGSEISLRGEFIQWCVNVDGKAKLTPLTYLPPLISVSKPMEVESMKSSWNGVYEFVFEKKPAKHALEITTASELDEIYGDLLKVYEVNDLPIPEGANAANWNKVRAWVKADKAKGANAVIIHASAFAKYRKFLEWREVNGGAAKGGPSGWTSYDAWAKAARETFAKVDAGVLAAADFDYLKFARKFVYNPTVANVYFKDHDANEKAEVGKFISQNRQAPKAASWYLDEQNLPKVKGLKSGVALNFMMKVRPAEFATFSPMLDNMLVATGVLKMQPPTELTLENYEASKSAQGQVLAKMHELHIGKAADDDSMADYLTVNEFAWWLSDKKNKDLIREEVMAKQQKKPTKDKVTTGKATISELLANKKDSLMTMLTAALLTKPLVILAGVSGTGKSRMVRHLAYKTCLDKDLQPQGGNAPGNFKMIQVKPNWHDSADLLGYRSVVSGDHEFVTTEFVKFVLKAHAYPDTPFFVCLDEMNLAPVEHYFAEFLSACESIRKNEQNVWISDPIVSPTDFDGEIINLGGDVKFESDDAALDAALKARKALIEKEGLFIPRNLFVVGTVNMDDTTNGFSRKVLDRAMTIEMNEVKFDELQKKDEGLSVAAANVFTPTEIKKFIDRADFDGQAMLNDEFRDQMEALRGKLEKSPFALAYRFARETTLYRKALMTILDQAKVVLDGNGQPKLDGASAPIDAERACGEIALDHMILMKVLPRFTGTVAERETIIKDVGEYLDALIKDKKVGKVKLDDMVERAKHNGGYLSFWP